MSKLDDAMQEHMAYLVLSIGRPFSFKDFLCFEVDGIEHKPTYGTVRNKLLAFKKKGIIEPDYNSGLAFYTLKGSKFGKPVTPYPYGGLSLSALDLEHLQISNSSNDNDPLYKRLQYLPFDKQSIHNVRIRLPVQPDIYKTFSKFNFPRNSNSGDIAIPSQLCRKDNAIIRIIVHRTDVISVTIGCSLKPIPLDLDGLIRFLSLLAEAHGLLSGLTLNQNDYQTTSFPPASPAVVTMKIPDYKTWIITMWHFGRDSLTEYTGKEFSITAEDAQHVLTRLYLKEFGNGSGRPTKKKIRFERQEYPNTTVVDAINEKLEQEASS